MSAGVRILGISAHYHDSAAALLVDGRIVASAQEERFTRVKGDAGFPHHAIAWCLGWAGITEDDLDHVAYYENPAVKLERLLTTHHVIAPRGFRRFLTSMPAWLTRKAFIAHHAGKEMGFRGEVVVGDHHLSHAASAFHPSPFEEAAILTIDGVGEWSTATIGVGRGNRVELLRELRFPNSLGLLYSAFTSYCGFRINSGEYKLMGLAPFGTPRHAAAIRRELAHLGTDGSITLNQRYFDYLGGTHMTNARFHELLGGPPREPEAPLLERHADVAASIQEVLDDAVLAMGRHAHELTGLPDLVMAGGVALNVTASGNLLRRGPFRRLWIQPAAGDAGGALGCALWLWHDVLGHPRRADPRDSMQGALLGPDIAPASDDDDAMLRRLGATWTALDDAALRSRIVDELERGRIVALARGRMELGPRSLGSRSILADARRPDMQVRLNVKVKFRETFRPFAPMVLAEKAEEWFDIACESPYMLLAFPVAARRMKPTDPDEPAGLDRIRSVRSEIPAVTHVDGSARVQTVDAGRSPFMHALLAELDARTGCPVVVNTSFNVRGEPIVSTVEDAYRCFMATDIDVLVAGNRVLAREEQAGCPLDEAGRAAWLRRFPLD